MSVSPSVQARSKLPKRRRRVLPVEQPRRRQPTAAKQPPQGKRGVNGMNVMGLAIQPAPSLLPLHQPLQARAAIVENPNIPPPNTISLASLQPPLMTMPPLQPRPATTGALDLMLPLQPKLLPGYNIHSSYLRAPPTTLVLPKDPAVDYKIETRDDKQFIVDKKPNLPSVSYTPQVEIILERAESVISETCGEKEDSKEQLTEVDDYQTETEADEELGDSSSECCKNADMFREVESDEIIRVEILHDGESNQVHNCSYVDSFNANQVKSVEINSNVIDNTDKVASNRNALHADCCTSANHCAKNSNSQNNNDDL